MHPPKGRNGGGAWVGGLEECRQHGRLLAQFRNALVGSGWATAVLRLDAQTGRENSPLTCVASISGGSLGERLPADCCEDLAPVSLSTPGGVWLQQHSSLLSFTTCWWYRSLQLSILFECLDLSSIQRRVDLVLEQMLGSVILQPILPV